MEVKNINGYDLKDEKARNQIININLFESNESKKFGLLGDSIAEGYGIWGGNRDNKTNVNDGFFGILRSKYPQHTFENLSISGSTLSSSTTGAHIEDQVSKLSGEYEAIFVLCGINDITCYLGDEDCLGDFKDPYNNVINNDYSTTYNALSSLFKDLKTYTKNIYYIVSPTSGSNIQAYESVYNNYKKMCKYHGVKIIDLYSVYPKKSFDETYYYDTYHPSTKGYEDIITPFIVKSVTGELNQYIINENEFFFLKFEEGAGNVLGSFISFTNMIKAYCKHTKWYENTNKLVTNWNSIWSVNFVREAGKVVVKAHNLNRKYIEYYAECAMNTSTYELTVEKAGVSNFVNYASFPGTKIADLWFNGTFVIKDISTVTDLPSGITSNHGYVYGKVYISWDGYDYFRTVELHPINSTDFYVINWLNNTKKSYKYTGVSI